MAGPFYVVPMTHTAVPLEMNKKTFLVASLTDTQIHRHTRIYICIYIFMYSYTSLWPEVKKTARKRKKEDINNINMQT